MRRPGQPLIGRAFGAPTARARALDGSRPHFKGKEVAPRTEEMSEVEGIEEIVRLLSESLDLCKKALREAERAADDEPSDPPS